jgi:hypothetical protein
LELHSTHRWVVESQTFADAGQSAFVLHPTQAPVLALQIAAREGHDDPPSPVHAVWHV